MAGVRRSRANPFKSTQLRQWGFICYLGGHIVSRRERTDRLRRASDGAAPREPAPTDDVAPRERLYPSSTASGSSWNSLLHPPSILTLGSNLRPFLSRFLPPPLLFYGRHPPHRRRRRCHPPEKRIRRYTSASKFPSDCPYLSLLRPPPNWPYSSLSFSGNFRWKNMALCLRFCIVSK